MTALYESLRKQLEKTVIQARDTAEEGARAALERLGVGKAKAYDGLSNGERDLRNRLRASGRQIGDVRNVSGEQETRRLSSELAYEYWHRMLFARFLAENDLLMHPDGISVSLADCAELAKEEGLANGWLLAEQWAARMLPEIFRPADALLQVPFAPEHERALEKLLEALPPETFRASDALGWVYQFWQARRKEEVNKSGVRIGADELPAVTQLFTEPYMVDFLLDNTLGAWWMGRHPGKEPPVTFEYLRQLEDGTPAAGTFDGWPKRAAELRVLDPCCGSGHFLVAAFHKLVPMRMHEEGLNAREACDAVLRDNLHGLEIDPRCTQIAAFAEALAAWTYPKSGGYRELPPLSIGCSGTPLEASKQDWLNLANGDERVRGTLSKLHQMFRNAPLLGSLIDPTDGTQGDILESGFSSTYPLLLAALQAEEVHRNADLYATAVTAKGMWQAAILLSSRFDLIVTNVPYLGRGDQHPTLQEYGERYYPEAKADLANMFLARCLKLASRDGAVGIVSPWNWLFLRSYELHRRQLLGSNELLLVIRLGESAFQSTQAAGAFTALTVVRRTHPSNTSTVRGLDASAEEGVLGKAREARFGQLRSRLQQELAKGRDCVISLESLNDGELLGKYARCLQGISTGDGDALVRCFWEVDDIGNGWQRYQMPPASTALFAGREHIVMWSKLEGGSPGAAIRGEQAWGSRGVAIGQMRSLPATMYSGEKFSNSTPVIVPLRDEYLPAIWAFCSSPAFGEALRRLNPKISIDNGYVAKVSWDYEHWRQISLSLPQPIVESSNNPTQWLFNGAVHSAAFVLHVAAARLLGYRWPSQQCDSIDAHADADGVVCLSSVNGERPAADRLRDLLASTYGIEWNVGKQAELLAASGSSDETLESWLRDHFFAQHCVLFHQQPFIWHVWDGRKDGFAALVNYHKLDRRTLQTLAYTYLGDWMTRQEADAKANKAGADLRLAAARALQHKLEVILEGEPPYDIFVRWKPIERQPVGWEPDLNDGVRLNIRPFVMADVLRKKPNIKWGKDRGKNPVGSPWGDERFNSYEEYSGGKPLTNAMKLAARDKPKLSK